MVAIIYAALLFMFVAAVAILTGHAATSSKHDNAIGSIQYFDNPNIYQVGKAVGLAYVGQSKAFTVRIQPLATYSLFTEDVLLCEGAELFAGKENPLVLTYRRQASRLIDGVGCHTLVRVDEMKKKELQ